MDTQSYQPGSTVDLSQPLQRVFELLSTPSRYKGVWGGRGSGKSHYMAGAVVEHCLLNPGSRIVCIREVQKTLAQSAKLLIENKIQEFDVGHLFRVLYDRIVTPGDGLISFQIARRGATRLLEPPELTRLVVAAIHARARNASRVTGASGSSVQSDFALSSGGSSSL
jgi:terminase large subunit-like protein